MAKKVRKPKAASPRTYAQTSGTTVPSSAATTTSAQAAPARKAINGAEPLVAKQVDLASEYAVVGGDLRRLLITAAIMFVVLIGINLALTFVF